VAAYGIRRRRPASSVGGGAGPIGVARWKQRSGGAAASSARPIGSVPSGGVAGRCGGSRGRGRRAARRSWGGRCQTGVVRRKRKGPVWRWWLGCAAGAFVSWTHSAVEFAGGLLLLVSPHAEFVLIFFSQFFNNQSRCMRDTHVQRI
jgi:hypothetical protein